MNCPECGADVEPVQVAVVNVPVDDEFVPDPLMECPNCFTSIPLHEWLALKEHTP